MKSKNKRIYSVKWVLLFALLMPERGVHGEDCDTLDGVVDCWEKGLTTVPVLKTEDVNGGKDDEDVEAKIIRV